MDYRNILATGFLLLCGAVFVHSLNSANALPTPQVSLGSNPYGSLKTSTCSTSTIQFTNNTSQPFMITDVFGLNSGVTIYINGATTVYFHVTTNMTSPHFRLESPIVVPPGGTLSCSGSNFSATGYYAHP